jgi:hypothetical protein
MKEKPYRIVGSAAFGKCIVKLKYGNKFVIVKCKEAMSSMKRIENSVNAAVRGGTIDPSGLYAFLIQYVISHPDNKFKVEYKESDSGYELLKEEQQLLDVNKSNPACLNNQTEAYIPNYNEETGMYGWITKQELLNFRRWQKGRQPKKTR